MQDQTRNLALEESFFDALDQYFKLTPVTDSCWEAKVFICKRWRITEAWQIPSMSIIMNGGRGVIRGRGFGLVDELFGHWNGRYRHAWYHKKYSMA